LTALHFGDTAEIAALVVGAVARFSLAYFGLVHHAAAPARERLVSRSQPLAWTVATAQAGPSGIAGGVSAGAVPRAA